MPIFVRDVKTTSYYENHPKEEARTQAGQLRSMGWLVGKETPFEKGYKIESIIPIFVALCKPEACARKECRKDVCTLINVCLFAVLQSEINLSCIGSARSSRYRSHRWPPISQIRRLWHTSSRWSPDCCQPAGFFPKRCTK
jgi:hypothetical protein